MQLRQTLACVSAGLFTRIFKSDCDQTRITRTCEFFKVIKYLVALVLLARAMLIILEKLTRVSFFLNFTSNHAITYILIT